MYKEVNRSLIKWPVAASATMLAMSWFPMEPAWEKREPSGVSSVSPSIDVAVVPDLSGTFVPSPTVVISSGDQSLALNHEQSGGDEPQTLANKFPERDASGQDGRDDQNELLDAGTPAELSDFSASRGVIKAPVRMIEQELAGLGLGAGSEGSAGQASGRTQGSSPTGMLPPHADDLLALEQCQRVLDQTHGDRHRSAPFEVIGEFNLV